MIDESVDHARNFLDEHKFVVDTIPVGSTGTSNLRASANRHEYIIEANSIADWRLLMEDGEGAERRAPSWKCLSQVVMGARERLTATPSTEGAFKIIWRAVTISGFVDRLAECLYGTQRLLLHPSRKSVECYHYNRNIFELCPEIDAAVLFTPTAGWLLVNYFSPNRVRFRQSVLYSLLPQWVIDPERKEGAVIIDSRISGPRDTSGTAQSEYIHKHYGIDFVLPISVRLGE